MDGDGVRVWRVRPWIRVTVVLIELLLVVQQVDTIGMAASGLVPRTEVRDGYGLLVVVALLIWRLAFHPRVTLEDGQIEVRNPVGRHRFAVTEVQDVEMTAWGLCFHLADGRRTYSIVLQDTAHLGEPRWHELAEAVTGSRPRSGYPSDAAGYGHDVGGEHTADEPGARGPAPTRELARRLAGELAGVATVGIADIDGGIAVTITPANARARDFGWADFTEEIVLKVGDLGGRWQLAGAPDDLAYLEDVARSVIAGRVREVLAPGRSRISVTLADRTVETETGYDMPAGCLPLPFWPRWSRTIQYEPYR